MARVPLLACVAWIAVALLGGCGSPPASAPPESPSAAPPGPGGPLEGSARVAGPAGDVTDEAGVPVDDAEPAADLRAVTLEGDGSALRVVFDLEGPVRPTASLVVWAVEIRLDGEDAYTVSAQLVGGRLVAALYDWDSGEQTPLPDPPETEGRRLVLVVPAELLARIDGPFRWTALSQLDGGYEDRMAESGFPESAATSS